MYTKWLIRSLILILIFSWSIPAIAKEPAPTVPPELLPSGSEEVNAAVVSYCKWFGWTVNGVEVIGTTPEVVFLIGTGPYPYYHNFDEAYFSEYAFEYWSGIDVFVTEWQKSYIHPDDWPRPGGKWWVGIAYLGIDLETQDYVFGQVYNPHQCFNSLIPIVVR